MVQVCHRPLPARVADLPGSSSVLDEIVSFTVPQNDRSWRVMHRIGLRRDPSGDFDHPRVDPVAYPRVVRHVFYRLARSEWLARSSGSTTA